MTMPERNVRLSVNVNKIATLRNARGGLVPSVVQLARIAIDAGADGITVHPRPDERHIRRADVFELVDAIAGQVEFNIEGYPSADFIDLVLAARPDQCTLVPDPPGVLTSNAGWRLEHPHPDLIAAIPRLQQAGIRISAFLDPDLTEVPRAAALGVDRIELYTEAFARAWGTPEGPHTLATYQRAAALAHALGLGLNAGHDLSLDNLRAFAEAIPTLDEVSIGHALISDALLVGLDASVRLYISQLTPS